MKEIFDVAGAILFSLGGAGVIVLALSSWLGKVWANRILANEKMQHSLALEKYKSEIEGAIQKTKFINESAMHISKRQYEKEFEIFQEIWTKLINLSDRTNELFLFFDEVPKDIEARRQFKIKRYSDYAVAYNEFLELTRKYSPFYKDEFKVLFDEFRSICYEQGVTYDVYIREPLSNGGVGKCNDLIHELSKDESLKIKRTNPGKIKELEIELANKIRSYLSSQREIL